MTDDRFKRMARWASLVPMAVGLEGGTLLVRAGTPGGHLAIYAVCLLPFLLTLPVIGWLGKRRPGHEHDNIWEALR